MAKSKTKKPAPAPVMHPSNYIRQKARQLPIFECWVNPNWDKTYTAEVVVARQHSNGKITLGAFIVDLGCQGVKKSGTIFSVSESEFRTIIREGTLGGKMKKISYVLAHNIIYGAIAYANELGFEPDLYFRDLAKYILEEDTDDVKLMEIVFGQRSVPYYMQGSDTDVECKEILRHLDAKVGAGNYKCLLVKDMEEAKAPESVSNEVLATKTVDQKRDLFLQLARKMVTQFSQDDRLELEQLTQSLFLDYCDRELLAELLESWKYEKEMLISMQEYTPAFLGVESGRSISSLDMELFDETYVLIVNNSERAAEKLNALWMKWGAIPLLCYYNLLILQYKSKNQYALKLNEYSTLYPDYAMFRLCKFALTAHRSRNKNKLPMIDFKQIFAGRTAITTFELEDYQLKKQMFILSRKNWTEFQALFTAMDELKLSKEFYAHIKSTLIVTRVEWLIKKFGTM